MKKIISLLLVISITLLFFINKISAQSNVSATVSEESQSLFDAVETNDIKAIKLLLEKGANPNAFAPVGVVANRNFSSYVCSYALGISAEWMANSKWFIVIGVESGFAYSLKSLL
jgi:hypothetical protein